MFGVTVGGHVELNGDFLTSAIREIKEETGLVVDSNDLLFIMQTKKKFLIKLLAI